LYKRAHDQIPDDDHVLASMAQLAASIGLHAEALEDYQELSRRNPNSSQWAAAVQREREAAMKEML
jgi:hypothetical protein